MPKTRRAWSKDDEKELCRLAAIGATCHEIAAALSRPEKSVRTAATRLGLKVSTRKSAVVEIALAPPPMPMSTSGPLTPDEFSQIAAARILSDDHRPWEERAFGECAAPVGVFDGRTHSCCRPVRTIRKGGRTVLGSYCREHHSLFFIPPTSSARDLERSLRKHRG